jgi:hypothetical protein
MSVNTADLLAGPQRSLIGPVDTSGWYNTQFGCLRSDPTLIARRHTFPDAPLPLGRPSNPAASVRFAEPSYATPESQLRETWSSQRIGCELYQSSSLLGSQTLVDPSATIEMARQHPQFAFRSGAPATDHQIWVESQLRCIDRPLGSCNQGTIPLDAPLFRNDAAPPTPVGVPEGVQNACNPQAAMIRGSAGGCRAAEDRTASAMSSRRFNNPTRFDTSQLPTLSR